MWPQLTAYWTFCAYWWVSSLCCLTTRTNSAFPQSPEIIDINIISRPYYVTIDIGLFYSTTPTGANLRGGNYMIFRAHLYRPPILHNQSTGPLRWLLLGLWCRHLYLAFQILRNNHNNSISFIISCASTYTC